LDQKKKKKNKKTKGLLSHLNRWGDEGSASNLLHVFWYNAGFWDATIDGIDHPKASGEGNVHSAKARAKDMTALCQTIFPEMPGFIGGKRKGF
jgi:hypothetical protein